jgi:hypothetical protein
MRTARTGFAIRLLMTVKAVLLANAHHARAQRPYFPDLVFLPKDKELNSIRDDMTTVHLRAMKEPSLWRLSREDRSAEAYRFLWLASYEHPISLCLTRGSGAFSLHVARHDGPPGVTAGRLTLNKDVKLNAQQEERLVSLLGKTTFWTAPVEVKESRGAADGDRIVIEGTKGGRYHVVSREGHATGESYKAFCRGLLELADVPDVLKAWDRFRQAERERSGYRPEPPQTADLGEREPDAEVP